MAPLDAVLVLIKCSFIPRLSDWSGAEGKQTCSVWSEAKAGAAESAT